MWPSRFPSLPSSHCFFCPATGHSYTSCWPVGLWKAKNPINTNTNTIEYTYYLQIQTQIQTNKQTHRFFCPATGHSIGRLCYWKAIRKKKADAKTSSLIPPEYTKSGPLQSIFVQFWILISYFKSSFLFVLSMCPCRGVGRMPITDCTKKCRRDLKYYSEGKSHDRNNGAYSILSTKLEWDFQQIWCHFWSVPLTIALEQLMIKMLANCLQRRHVLL